MPKKVSDEDRQRAEALFAIGKSFRDIAAELDGRVSASWLSTTARAEGWLRGVLPDKLLGEDTPQIYESANATAVERDENTARIAAATRRNFAVRKVEIADQLIDGVLRLYGQMFSPVTLKEQKLVGQGEGRQVVTLVETDLNEPTPADKKLLAVALGILVDKASLLSGDATSRVETSSMNRDQLKDRLTHFRDELKERRDKLEQDNARKSDEATG